jgi:alpha-N-arabinofuranosidase
MEMYNVHQDAILIPTQVKSNDYTFGNEKLPAVSVAASKDKKGITHISLVNIDASKAQDISIALNGAKYSTVTGRILTSNKLQDYNSFNNPEKITPINFTGAVLATDALQIKLPPFSVVVLTLN